MLSARFGQRFGSSEMRGKSHLPQWLVGTQLITVSPLIDPYGNNNPAIEADDHMPETKKVWT